MYIIQRSHSNFLRKQFFEIAKSTYQIQMIDVVMEKNNDILETQISNDSSEINNFFKIHRENIIKMQSVIYESMDNTPKGRTNYAMRETETTKEIEVIVEAGKNIDSVIESDF